MAESQLPTPEGYRQTMFSWHAPTVFAKAREFDKEFNRICDERKQTVEEARNAAKEKIDELIKLEEKKVKIKRRKRCQEK